MPLAESGVLTPAVALWLPNILFLSVAGAGMWVVAGEREVNFRMLASWTLRVLGVKRAGA